MRTYVFDVVVNGLLSSRLLPPRLRWLALRLAGLDVSACTILEGAYFSTAATSIGRGSYLGPGFYAHCLGGVVIGPRCALGPQVMLMTGGHEVGGADARAGSSTFEPITIGAGSWLGARVTVLPGVSIGEGCIVAAGAVVTRDLAAHRMYAGVPAREVRTLSMEDG